MPTKTEPKEPTESPSPAPPGAVADAVAAAVAKPVDPDPALFPGTLAESMVRALGVLQNVTKARVANVEHRSGGSHTIAYADLGDTLAAVRPVLARFGLAITQEATTGERQVTVRTTLLHWTGTFKTSEPLSLPSGTLPQDVGSAITYARRYQLTAMLGLGADDDDGAQAAAGVGRPSRPQGQRRRVVEGREAKPPKDPSEMAADELLAHEFGIPKGKVLVDAVRYCRDNDMTPPGTASKITPEVIEHLRAEYTRQRDEAEAQS